ncbi:MAG: hypothetical protein ABI778_10830 [Ignavibacteriota bacterium]
MQKTPHNTDFTKAAPEIPVILIGYGNLFLKGFEGLIYNMKALPSKGTGLSLVCLINIPFLFMRTGSYEW